jgi:hypothetical protein
MHHTRGLCSWARTGKGPSLIIVSSFYLEKNVFFLVNFLLSYFLEQSFLGSKNIKIPREKGSSIS